MKRQRLDKTVSKYARFGDIKFPQENPLADYDSTWTKHFNDGTLITAKGKSKKRGHLWGVDFGDWILVTTMVEFLQIKFLLKNF